jgi:aspartate ammonia-lyase
MKSILLKIAFLFFVINTTFAQGTYTSANYAAVNDILYVTSANNFTNDYFSTGTNYSWNFSNLIGTNQLKMQYKSPSSSGYSFILFPYIYIPGNTNLAATDGVIRNLNLLGQVIGTNSAYDYFKKSTADLRQVASAYKLNYNGTQIPVTTTFSAPDVIYKFPINFGNTDVSNSAFTMLRPIFRTVT